MWEVNKHTGTKVYLPMGDLLKRFAALGIKYESVRKAVAENQYYNGEHAWFYD
jgi:hypothetical protein